MKYDVFLSKNSADQALADSVLSFLDAAGIKVFESSRDLPNLRDSDYSKAIFDALENSETIIIICTPNENGNKSGWVYEEWSTFINEVRSKRREGRIMTIRKGIPIKDLDPQLRKYESFEFDTYQTRILPYFGKTAVVQPEPSVAPVTPMKDPAPIKVPDEELDNFDDVFENARRKARKQLLEKDVYTLCEAYVDDVIHRKFTRLIKSEPQIKEYAEDGFADAEYALGFSESYPYGSNLQVGDEHYNKAVFWLTKAANKGHVKANQQLAHVYYWAKEINKAIPCAKFAAKGDNLDAAIILYWAYKDLKQYPEYVEALKAAAELQKKLKKTNIHAPAFEYGKLLLEGEYVPKDLMQSIKWFDVAAKLSYELRQSEKASEYKEKARKEMAKSVLSSINPFKK